MQLRARGESEPHGYFCNFIIGHDGRYPTWLLGFHLAGGIEINFALHMSIILQRSMYHARN